MGTNYYVKTGRKVRYRGFDVDEILHVGKSSYGWYFNLHIIPHEGINSLRDWIPYLQGGEIHDEYGEHIPYEVMMHVIKRTGCVETGHWGAKKDAPEPHTIFQLGCGHTTFYGEHGLLYVIESFPYDLRHSLPIPSDIEGLYFYVDGDFS